MTGVGVVVVGLSLSLSLGLMTFVFFSVSSSHQLRHFNHHDHQHHHHHHHHQQQQQHHQHRNHQNRNDERSSALHRAQIPVVVDVKSKRSPHLQQQEDASSSPSPTTTTTTAAATTATSLVVVFNSSSSDEDATNDSASSLSSSSSSSSLVRCPQGCSHATQDEKQEEGHRDVDHDEDHEDGIHVASWRWFYVRTPFVYTFFIVLAGLCKVGFHHADLLSSLLPESCLLIILGSIVGGIIYVTGSKEEMPNFESKTFFLFLLPPIMLESAYSLHDRAFAENLGTVLLYAVVGTLINCFTIGPTLYGLACAGAMGDFNIDVIEALVFSSLISAVDPVAVLAIFQEVGVNKDLYFLVFGESLLNDAVTVVLYTTMVAFRSMGSIQAEHVGLGIAAFFCVSIGGLCIGIIFGILTALITKFTEEVRVVEPLALFGMAYMSYLMAEMVHFSGIISIIGCGLVQAQYAVANISSKSYTTVKYFSKMLSATCDCIIFFFLGMVLVNDKHSWQTGFVLWTVVLCLLYRFLSVFFLTYLVNHSEKIRHIDYKEQFIMAYGGLRGAVSFSLVIMLKDDKIPNKQLFVTTTLVIVLFTVFIQGGTIKPLVKWLEIKSGKEEHLSITCEINSTMIDHVMAGIEEIAGERGENYLKLLIYRYDEKYLKKWLQRSTTEGNNLFRVYEKLAIQDHYAHLYGPTASEEEKQIILHNTLVSEDEDMRPISPLPKKQPPAKKRDKRKGPTCPFGPALFETAKPKGKVSMIAQTLVGVGQTVASPLLMDSMQAHQTLRKALKDNYYNKFHQKYNPNLIRDDEQELTEQLRLRRLRARRLTMVALSPTTSNQSSRTDLSQVAEESEVASMRTHADRHRSQSLANPSDVLAEKARHRRRHNMMKAHTMDDTTTTTTTTSPQQQQQQPQHRQLVALRSNGSISSVESDRSTSSRNSLADMELKAVPLDTITENDNDNEGLNGGGGGGGGRNDDSETEPFLDDSSTRQTTDAATSTSAAASAAAAAAAAASTLSDSPNRRRRQRLLNKEHKVDVEEEEEKDDDDDDDPETVV